MTLRKNRHAHSSLPSRRRQLGLALAAALLLPFGLAQPAQAARSWILPSQTVLGPATRWVSFEAASSNNLFNPNGRAIPVENIAVTGPDGQPRELVNAFNGRLRSAFELELKEPGTYRIEQVPAAPGAAQGGRPGGAQGAQGGQGNPGGGQGRQGGGGQGGGAAAPAQAQAQGAGRGSQAAAPTAAPTGPTYFGSYRGEDGQMVRWRGTIEELRTQGIADKPELTLSERGRSRLVTFVTLGEPSDAVLSPEGNGLELDFERTHPNDLYADEPASFRVLVDGKPAAGARVTIVREGDRYRDEEGAIILETNAQGWVSIDWPGTGRYFVQARASQKGTLHGIPSTKTHSYAAILEVL